MCFVAKPRLGVRRGVAGVRVGRAGMGDRVCPEDYLPQIFIHINFTRSGGGLTPHPYPKCADVPGIFQPVPPEPREDSRAQGAEGAQLQQRKPLRTLPNGQRRGSTQQDAWSPSLILGRHPADHRPGCPTSLGHLLPGSQGSCTDFLRTMCVSMPSERGLLVSMNENKCYGPGAFLSSVHL